MRRLLRAKSPVRLARGDVTTLEDMAVLERLSRSTATKTRAGKGECGTSRTTRDLTPQRLQTFVEHQAHMVGLAGVAMLPADRDVRHWTARQAGQPPWQAGTDSR